MTRRMVLPDCDLCHGRPVDADRTDGLCFECGDWTDYWNSLTPKQQDAEREMMAHYTSDHAAEVER